MNTKKLNTPETSLIIGPQHTLLDGEIHHPHNIVIMLENGHSYDIDEVIDILEALDKKKHKKKPKMFRRVRHVKQAVGRAMREALDDDAPRQP